MAATSPMPASPATPPPMNMSTMIDRAIGMPLRRAASGLPPMARISSPSASGRESNDKPARRGRRADPDGPACRRRKAAWPRRQRGALRVVGALRVLPGPEDEEAHEQGGHVIQQQGRDGLAHPSSGPQEARSQRPQPPSEKSQERNPGEEKPGREGTEVSAPQAGKQGSDEELALPAHVDEPDPGRQRHRHGREDERNHLHQEFGKAVAVAKGVWRRCPRRPGADSCRRGAARAKAARANPKSPTKRIRRPPPASVPGALFSAQRLLASASTGHQVADLVHGDLRGGAVLTILPLVQHEQQVPQRPKSSSRSSEISSTPRRRRGSEELPAPPRRSARRGRGSGKRR